MIRVALFSFVVFIILCSTIAMFFTNIKYYTGRTDLKSKMIESFKRISSEDSQTKKNDFVWFVTELNENKITIVNTNFRGDKKSYETILSKDIDKIRVRSITGGGFFHLKMHQDGEQNRKQDTLAYCNSSENGRVVIVTETIL